MLRKERTSELSETKKNHLKALHPHPWGAQSFSEAVAPSQHPSAGLHDGGRAQGRLLRVCAPAFNQGQSQQEQADFLWLPKGETNLLYRRQHTHTHTHTHTL